MADQDDNQYSVSKELEEGPILQFEPDEEVEEMIRQLKFSGRLKDGKIIDNRPSGNPCFAPTTWRPSKPTIIDSEQVVTLKNGPDLVPLQDLSNELLLQARTPPAGPKQDVFPNRSLPHVRPASHHRANDRNLSFNTAPSPVQATSTAIQATLLTRKDEEIVENMSRVLEVFNETVQKEKATAEDNERHRIQNNPIISYFITHPRKREPAMLNKIDLITGESKTVPAAELARSQSEKICEQVDEIEHLMEKVQEHEAHAVIQQASIEELQHQVHCGMEEIRQLRAEAAEKDRRFGTFDIGMGEGGDTHATGCGDDV